MGIPDYHISSQDRRNDRNFQEGLGGLKTPAQIYTKFTSPWKEEIKKQKEITKRKTKTSGKYHNAFSTAVLEDAFLWFDMGIASNFKKAINDGEFTEQELIDVVDKVPGLVFSGLWSYPNSEVVYAEKLYKQADYDKYDMLELTFTDKFDNDMFVKLLNARIPEEYKIKIK
jgi:hypothetical protein